MTKINIRNIMNLTIEELADLSDEELLALAEDAYEILLNANNIKNRIDGAITFKHLDKQGSFYYSTYC